MAFNVTYNFTNGTTADADEVNTNFEDIEQEIDKLNISPINQIYTGSDFDTSANNSTDEASYELTSISSSDLTDKNYVIIKITGTYSTTTEMINETSSGESSVELKIQLKELGDSYADILPYTKLLAQSMTGGITSSSSHSQSISKSDTFTYIHTLTTDEKTNGIQLKIFSKSIGNNNASFNNIQTKIILSR